VSRGRGAEAVATAVAGAALGGLAGSVVGLGAPVAAVAGVNGALGGWRRVYAWRSPVGVLAFALDSTWAAPNTATALLAHAGGAVRGRAGFVAQLSERQNRHVYARGMQFRRGFAITLGNVVSGAGDVEARPRRVQLVTDHEDVHVWQARWFGPVFFPLYGGWMAGGALAGAVAWLTHRRHQPFGKVVESCAYYLNPFEWWAYSRDGNWPPRGLVQHLGWRRPVVPSFATLAASGRRPRRQRS
jgi:hypothetical protein